MFTKAYREYLKEQKENARLGNRIKFIGGLAMAGFKKRLNIHSPSQMLNDTARKAVEDARKELGW